MAEIHGQGSLTADTVTVTLAMGDATLVVTYPRDDDEAVLDMVAIVENAAEAVSDVLEAVIAAAEEADRGGE